MFQKTELKLFREDFAKAVKDLEKKYGVKLELHNISYTDVEFHTKLTATRVGETGEKEVNTADFNWLKDLLGFKGNIGIVILTARELFILYTISMERNQSFPF